jgi:signal transduction histidine kinase
MKSFFQPAIAIMNRLRYPQKFVLVGALLLIPTIVLLTQYLNSVNYDIEFAENESIGTHYIQPLFEVMVAVQQYVWLREDTLSDENDATAVLDAARSDVETRISAMNAQHERLSPQIALGSGTWQQVQADWQAIREGAPTLSAADLRGLRNRFMQSMIVLFAEVGNQSNLILDPDIDSYYLMDSVINHFPSLIDLIGLLNASQTAEGADGTIAIIAGQMINRLAEMERGLGFSYSVNPSLEAILATPTTSSALVGLERLANGLLTQSEPVAADAPSLLMSGLVERFTAFNNALDNLLQIRINGFEQARNTVIIIAIAAVLASVYFFTGFYLAVRKTIDDLGHASDIMVSGSSSGGQTITLQNRDEMAEVVTSFNRVASEMVAARDQAVKASRLKDEFLATMSHELRTPLNSIIGYTGILTSGMRGQIDDTAKGVLIRVRESSQNLLSLINDILDIAKIEAGRMEVVDAPFELSQLVEQLQAQAEVLARQKQLNLDVLVDPELPKTLYGDIDKIGQVVRNLLSNAVKFTDEGVVRLRVFKKSDSIIYEVTDTGVGIPPQAIDYIFDEFRQVDGTTRRVYGGTGLGLAIVRKLCLAMGGRVQVQSKIGVGSTFTVTLPLHAETTAASVLRSVSNE